MNEKLSCEIVKDLLPLSSEGLCSEESRAAIEAHVKACEGCRRLFAQLPEVKGPEAPVPDEGRAFRKVNKKLKNRLIKMIVLGVVLLFVLGGLGYLSIGQVMKSEGQQSFETIWQSIEVRRLAKMVARGDFDSYLKEASAGDLIDGMIYEQDFDEIREKDKQLVQTAWQAAYGGEKVSSIKVETFYSGYGPTRAAIPYSTAFVHYESGRKMQLYFNKDKDGKYVGSVSAGYPGEKEAAEMKFRQAFEFISMHDLDPRGWLGQILTNDEPIKEKEKAELRTQFLTQHLTPEWHDRIEKQMIAFYMKGYRITGFTVAGVLYDKELGTLYHDVTVEAADWQGSVVLLTRFYVGADGLRPTPERNKVFSDGCTEALTADLASLFS